MKPRNLILGERGIVLVDFGVARELDADDPGTRAVGTPQFMAPEVLVGESISPRSDVFGIAATLWTLLTGKPPAYDDRTPLAERVPGVTTALEETLRAGLALHPERRIASAQAFARALGSPLGPSAGASLALSVEGPQADGRTLIESFVRTAAGVFEAAAASLAVVDEATGELVYRAAWGAGAEEVVGRPAARRQRYLGSGRRRDGGDRGPELPQRSAVRGPHRRRAPAMCPIRCSSCRSFATGRRSERSRCSIAATGAPTAPPTSNAHSSSRT